MSTCTAPASWPPLLEQITSEAKLRIHITTSNVAYAVATLEADESPRFQLGTYIRMGLTDEEVMDPTVVERMKWEFRSWAVGHGLSDISEALAGLLNGLALNWGKPLGYRSSFQRFERLGLAAKIRELTRIQIDADYIDALTTITAARNCLIHRHGIVGPKDCGDSGGLLLKWRGIRLFRVFPSGIREFDPSHRGPATQNAGDMGQLQIDQVAKTFPLGSRLDLEPVDLCTLSWCIQGVATAIQRSVSSVLSTSPTVSPSGNHR